MCTTTPSLHVQIKVDTSGQEASDDVTLPYQHSQHRQAAASGISRSPTADGAGNEAAGDTEQHAHKALKPRGNNHKDAQGYETATSPPHPTTAGNHMAAARDHTAAAGDQPGGSKDHMAADLQEGEAGESTPNLDGGSRVPAGHLDHGLPAEGLRMHTDPAGTDGVTEGVTEGVVSGRAAPNAANASQALNKKVLAFFMQCMFIHTIMSAILRFLHLTECFPHTLNAFCRL